MAETDQAELTIGGDMESMGRAFFVTACFLMGFIVVHLFRRCRREAISERTVMRHVRHGASKIDVRAQDDLGDRELAIIGRLGFRP